MDMKAVPSSSQPICANPPEWAKLHAAAMNAAADGDPFPKPLILAGWAFSSDEEKRQRWSDSVAWLQERGLELLIVSEVEGGWYHG
jgi:hypothetical protein